MAMTDQRQREIHDALRKAAGIHQLAGVHEEGMASRMKLSAPSSIFCAITCASKAG